MSLESAYNTIEKLVNDFKNNERHYLASDYSESQARLDFIDKLFIALGWDVNHEHQKNPYEQEVKVERRVRDKEAQKRADYAFFLEPNFRDPKFYVEAKKPSRSLDNPYDYFQAIRYGWNAQTPLVVLTDFEEFHILDSRFKPDIKFTKERKVLSFHYSDYLDKEKFAKLYYLFSREAVGNGAIEKFAETMTKPRGKAVQKGLFPGSYQSIDESFLTELDEIRNTLARSFKKKNPALTSEELTEATQRTIDRLVFIRFLEDMLIEGEHHISNYGDKGTAWGDFIADCRSLNAKYNGIVFKEHFIDKTLPLTKGELREQSGIQRGSVPPLNKGGQSAPKVREGGSAIAPDDKDFADICEELSHVNSPYNFNSIPIHILGSIYERFLGKVVHATEKRVTIEEKPEVRKAGGVYYTPQYIVQYIVNNTVGKLIEGKTPAEIAKLRFADISCGSGSFLITVYDTLLRYHSNWYQDNPKSAKADGCILSNGLWVLSLKQKRQILLNNVYGVDIDHQAVEVTQLSLYLKLLEDETLATANEMQAMFKEKILPDLSKNIICGNSLIGTDIYDGNMFPSEEEKKINAMNFEDAFPAIMKNGGFDAIVGNPPYGRVDSSKSYSNYLREHYKTVEFKVDTYSLFIERAINLGFKVLGLIVPSNLMINLTERKLRKYILENTSINLIFNHKYPVFEDAVIHTMLLLLSKPKTDQHSIQAIEAFSRDDLKIFYVKQVEFNKEENFMFNVRMYGDDFYLINKIKEDTRALDEIYEIKQAIKTGDDKKYITHKKIANNYFEVLGGKEMGRYYLNYGGRYVNYGKFLACPRDPRIFEAKEKILIRETGARISCTLDNQKFYLLSSVYSCLPLANCDLNIRYVLGILNSNLVQYYMQKLCFDNNIGAFTKARIFHYQILPIKLVNLGNEKERKLHDRIVNLVDQMLTTKKLLNSATTDKDKNFYENKCNTLDRQIDRLVYELYGLTEEEIKIVEGE